MISEAELDNFIYAIVEDCRAVSPPLRQSEIEEIAVDRVENYLKQQISASLARLVKQGLLSGEHGAGMPKRYGLVREIAA